MESGDVTAKAVLTASETTAYVPDDEILDRSDVVAQAKRLRTSAFEALESNPDYLKATARSVREKHISGIVEVDFPCGDKVVKVSINNGWYTAGELKDRLNLRVYP